MSRLSRRIKSLASDSQLWKALFYDKFVRPRALRIPGIRNLSRSEGSLFYASRNSKWLQDEGLVRDGRGTNWKRQYKLRHNWSRGMARVKEAQIADKGSVPPLLVRLKGVYVFVADADQGLKVWDVTGDAGTKIRAPLNPSVPTSLAVDSSDNQMDDISVSVGFLDGSFSVYTFLCSQTRLVLRFRHPAPGTLLDIGNGSRKVPDQRISAIAFAKPFLITLDSESRFSFYRLQEDCLDPQRYEWRLPLLVSSMKSHIASAPLSLSLRPSGSEFLASITYPVSVWRRRWSVGLQEFRIASDGSLIDSRTASTDLKSQKTTSNKETPSNMYRDHDITSISYSHPYLLTSHCDNTLTIHMVTSTANELKIGSEHRLWGHTTAVQGAHVSNRGKAVSVSTFGDDLRVWNLEGGSSLSRSQPIGQNSIRIQQRNKSGRDKLKVGIEDFRSCGFTERAISGWLTFDEEKVVLLQGRVDGPQALVTYDFT